MQLSPKKIFPSKNRQWFLDELLDAICHDSVTPDGFQLILFFVFGLLSTSIKNKNENIFFNKRQLKKLNLFIY